MRFRALIALVLFVLTAGRAEFAHPEAAAGAPGKGGAGSEAIPARPDGTGPPPGGSGDALRAGERSGGESPAPGRKAPSVASEHALRAGERSGGESPAPGQKAPSVASEHALRAGERSGGESPAPGQKAPPVVSKRALRAGEQESVFDRSETAPLVLQVRLRDFILSENLVGHLHREGLLLPLGELAFLLEWGITVDPQSGFAWGWYQNENRAFYLDLNDGTATVEGKRSPLNTRLVERRPQDLYVHTSLLSRWFPLDFEFNLSSLKIEILNHEPLLLENRLVRQQKVKETKRQPETDSLPRVRPPYKILDWPSMDLSYDFNYKSEEDQAQSLYSALLAGDVLYMDSEVFLAGDERDSLSDVRLRLGRKDPEGGLFGPLSAREFALGDIFNPQLPLVADSRSGAGFEISSFPFYRQGEFDRINLRGELSVGWQVELYRNEVLLDSQVTPNADGRFEFLDVPLLFGSNVLRLVFYGPQGQKRETIRRIFVGEEQVRAGRQYFRLSGNFQEQDLVQVGEDANSLEPEKGRARYFAEYERGLSRHISVAGNIASLPFEGDRRNYGTLGLRASLGGAFSRLGVTRDDKGGTAAQIATLTDLFGVNLFLEHGHFFDFVSERVARAADPLESTTNLRLDSAVPGFFLPRIPITIEGELDRRESGRVEIDLSNRLSMYFGGVSVSNTLNWFLNRGGQQEPFTQGDGTLLANGRILRLSLRGALDYGIEPVTELTRTSVTGDYDLTRNLSTRLTVDRILNGERETIYSAGLNRRFPMFALGMEGSYSDEGDYALGSSLTFSLGREPRGKRWVVLADRMATQGAASARVFLDKNHNGAFDEADEPLENIEVQEGTRSVRTDRQGLAFLPGLASYQPVSLSVDQASLEDPFWMLAREGMEVVPRPGSPALINFPVIPTGEIGGSVFLGHGASRRAAANVKVELVKQRDELEERLKRQTLRHYIDSEGEIARKIDFHHMREREFFTSAVSGQRPRLIERFKLPLKMEEAAVVQSVRSAYDGGFLFARVPPGRYTLRVSPSQMRRLGLLADSEHGVEIRAAGQREDGLQLVVEPDFRNPPRTAPNDAEEYELVSYTAK